MPLTMPLDRLHLVGVAVVCNNPLTLRCDGCGAVWPGLAHQSDFLKANYWICPENDCNGALSGPTLGELAQSQGV